MALKVGIQLFSVRDMMQEDPKSTIKKVADLGYKYIEPANLFEKWGYDMGLTSSEKFKASYSHDGFTEVVSKWKIRRLKERKRKCWIR